MKLDALINLIFENQNEDSTLDFPRIVSELPDGMLKQESNISGIDFEWISGGIEEWGHYHGELAYKLDDGRFLIFEYWT